MQWLYITAEQAQGHREGTRSIGQELGQDVSSSLPSFLPLSRAQNADCERESFPLDATERLSDKSKFFQPVQLIFLITELFALPSRPPLFS